MTKSELTAIVAAQIPPGSRRHVEAAVNAIFLAMTAALVREDRIELRGLGCFRTRLRQARVGRNPKTGETVPIAPRRVVLFTPGKALKERVGGAAG